MFKNSSILYKEILFKINDFQYTSSENITLIQACLQNKIDVPRFCFHEKLSIAGNCRMCLVEDLKQVKPLASCAINITNGMSVYTNTIKVKKAREGVLEFLLVNHPLDCPICDQGGECDLQDQSVVFGGDRGRFYEFKRSVEDKDCGPLVKTVMNRCIHCTRCVRFSSEIAGINFLGVTGRGSRMEIGFYVNKLLNSELSGNVIDLCPVGALTSKPFSFTARSWELRNFSTLDILDSFGSNIRLDIRGSKIMRVLPRINESLNQDWITDKIRFSYDGLRRQRLYEPMVKNNGKFLKLSWRHVFYFVKSLFFSCISSFIPQKYRFFFVNTFLGNLLDTETILAVKYFNTKLGASSLFSKNNTFVPDFREYYSFNMPLSKLSLTDLCLLVYTNLRLELPLLHVRLRNNFLKKGCLVYLIGYQSNFNFFIKHLGLNFLILIRILEGLHWLCTKLTKNFSNNPLIIVSSNVLNLSNTYFFLNMFNYFKKFSNFFLPDWLGFHFLNNNISDFSKYELNLFSFVHNQNFFNSKNSLYYLVGFDSNIPFKHPKKNCVIYQGHHGDIGATLSNVILPSTVFIEKTATYMNFFGLQQFSKKAIFNLANSRDDWKITVALSEVLGLNLGVLNSYCLIKLRDNISPFFVFNSFSNVYNFSFFFKPFFIINVANYFNSSYLNNFYTNDVISRSSKIMSLCANRFKIKNYNFGL